MEDYTGAGAYGAGGATGQFNPVAFIKKPDVILRIVGWIFAVVVIGCISSQGYVPIDGKHECAYSGISGACGYGTFVGVMAFLGLLAFLIMTALFENISNVEHRKYIVMGDIVYSGLMTFLWFVSFCYLTNKWTTAPRQYKEPNRSGPEAAIAFSFFSIIIFGVLTFLAVRQYRLGVADNFQSPYDPDVYREGGAAAAQSPYMGTAGATGAYQGGETYQPSPFTPTEPKPAAGGYQPQSY